MEFHVYENARAACEAAGVLIAAQITRKGDSVLGLATGSTPIPAYEMLAQWYDRGVIDFDRVRTFNLDEYVGIDHKNPLSYHAFMQEHLFSKVNLRPENVHLPSGNGAADVIFRLALAVRPRRALLPAPTFAEYAAALDTVGCEVTQFALDAANDFAVTDAFINAVTPETDVVFLCQPNNPTGQVTPPALVEKLLHRCAACGAALVVDECFLDFLPDRDTLTAKTFLHEATNLIILKAFTKLYAMAGVRLGYALCSNADLLAKMQAAGQPWAVSSLAQAAGIAALQETAYADAVRALIADQRPKMAAGLRALGLYVIDGQANYLLFKAPADFGEALRQHGAVVRSCANYPGLDAAWYRTAVRTAAENDQLLQIMGEVLA